MKVRNLVKSSVFVGVCMLGGQLAAVDAAVVSTYQGNGDATHFDGDISATDLVNTGQSTLSSASETPTGSGFVETNVNDGTNAEAFYTSFPDIVTFNLNGATGFDITKINSIAGFGGGNYGYQSFQLLLSTISTPTFTSYGTFTNTPVDDDMPGDFGSDDGGSTETTLTGDPTATLPITTGVTGVELIYSDPTGSAGTLIREIDVFGSASAGVGTSVPEPTSLALIGLSAVGLISRRRRVV